MPLGYLPIERSKRWTDGETTARSGSGRRIRAKEPDIDLAKIDATTEADIHRHMREEGYDPDEAIAEEDIISPAVIRKRLNLSPRQFAAAIHVPLATLQNWKQGRVLMDPSARSLMTVLAREPEAALRALRALGYQLAA